jgi:CRISPR-associated protein Csm1
LEDIEDSNVPEAFKSLEFIARDDRWPLEGSTEQYQGVEALVTLKGDVDNLGKIFEKGLAEPSFAKTAALSRQMNVFFSIWLPWYCKEKYPNTYTVFAGGDDFFLIGPWRSTLHLARDMHKEFARYVAQNKEIHFSAGLSMTRPGLPIRQMGEMAEQALEQAKDYTDEKGTVVKKAVTCFGYTVGWDNFDDLLKRAADMEQMRDRLELATGYLYGLQYLADMAEDLKSDKPNIESALWNSRFTYRTWRMLERKRGLNKDERRRLHEELGRSLGGGINQYGSAFKIALFTHLYHHRH